MLTDRLNRVFELAYDCLRLKINGGLIRVDNEASLQLHFSAILKSVGELHEVHRDEFFFIELEKPVKRTKTLFRKSGSAKAKVDIFCGYSDAAGGKTHACAIELKHFKKKNHREPNNRYDVFADIHNLENYGSFADCCFLVVATDHEHYVNQTAYSPDTSDFDLRHGACYTSGTQTLYRTQKPYGAPITLTNSYSFNWDTTVGGLHFLRLAVRPRHD